LPLRTLAREQAAETSNRQFYLDMQLLTTTHWSSGGHGRNGPSLAANSNPHCPNNRNLLHHSFSNLVPSPVIVFPLEHESDLAAKPRQRTSPTMFARPSVSIIPQLYLTENVTHLYQDCFSHTSSVCNRPQSRVYPNRQITNKHSNPQQRASNQHSHNWLGFPFGRAGGANIPQ